MSMNRKQSLAATSTAAGLFLLLATGTARAAEHYVAPDGSDSNRGTMDRPFATLSKANSAAAAGDTIWVRGGTYDITTQLVLSRSGTSDTNRTKIWAYPGEKPVLDASRYVTSNPAVDVPLVLVTGSWMHLRGLEIGNAKVGRSGDHSYSLLRTKGSSNNIFELLNLHHAFGPGLFIDKGEGGNLILNCDSHDNYDQNGSQGDGQNGDGFGVHYQTTGPSTIIRGCRAWNNSDDGYDYISHEVPVITEGSFAMSNGRGSGGNGNGFKVGSSKTGIRHIVRNNVAWNNKAAGFYANHSSGGNTWLNNTAYKNGTQYNMLASPPDDSSQAIILTGALAHIMRNNVGFPNKNSNMGGVDTAFNTWDLNITEASSAFESTSDAGCTGPREADGSLPSACVFMKLAAESALIDEGTDVGLPFVGSAPDLGAYELGAGPTAGTGGGAAGGSGTAGGGMGGTAAQGSGGGGSGSTVGASGGMGAAGGAGQGGAPGTGGSPEAGGATGGTDDTSGGRAGAAGTSEDDDSSAAGCACAAASDDATAGSGGFAFLALASAFAARSRDGRTARRKGGRPSRF
ncbi:right-handed parallel beta-helix repeat-containing protein [Sorangium sp. So ce291]|uniref:right-handed parallel beta-helix repeat-containing protein n=1 Tax=Sorangium sp. So ce291 TaxID=3133294 RepID=UPI003F600045